MKHLPFTSAKFQGKAEQFIEDSVAVPLEKKQLPDSAPNVLLIMLDDVGFGSAATFGGPVEMPAVSEIAKTGISYNQFHTTALCSPTRASLLTGRNHHSFIWEESQR